MDLDLLLSICLARLVPVPDTGPDLVRGMDDRHAGRFNDTSRASIAEAQ
jgi:hypothetical protein